MSPLARPLTSLIAACVVTGCAGDLTRSDTTSGQAPIALSQVPTASQVFGGEYQRLASCSYEKLDSDAGGSLKKIDLPVDGLIKLNNASGGTRFWEATFTRLSQKQTRVDITAAATLWGPFPGSDKVLATIASCADH